MTSGLENRRGVFAPALAAVLTASLVWSCGGDKKDGGGGGDAPAPQTTDPNVVDHTGGEGGTGGTTGNGGPDGRNADAVSFGAVPLKLRNYLELYKTVTQLLDIPETHNELRNFFNSSVSGSLTSSPDPTQFSGTYLLAALKFLSYGCDIAYNENNPERRTAIWNVADPGSAPGLMLLSSDGLKDAARSVLARGNSVVVDDMQASDERVVMVAKAMEDVVKEMAARTPPASEPEIKRAALVTGCTTGIGAHAKLWFY